MTLAPFAVPEYTAADFSQETWWLSLIKAVFIIVFLIANVLLALWVERRGLGRMQTRPGPNVAGPLGLFQAFADAGKLLFKEDMWTRRAERFLYFLAPAIAAFAAFSVYAVIPMGPNVSIFGHSTPLQLADMPVASLYILAIASLGLYGIVLGGWSTRSTLPLYGAVRSSAQVISYELAMGLSLVSVFLMSGTMSTSQIVAAQGQFWWAFTLFPAFVIYCISATGEVNRLPFDLPEAEGEIVAGPLGLFQAFADAGKLLFKEDMWTRRAERFLYFLAPAIAAFAAFSVYAVIPMGPNVTIFGHSTPMQLADMPVASLYILAIASLGLYGIVLGGWSTRSTLPLYGAVRSSAQVISYELAMGLSLVSVFLMSGSMSTSQIVAAQGQFWWAFTLFPAFVIYCISAVGEVNRLPFDLPEAEGEIVAGHMTEYSSMKFGWYYLSEYVNMLNVSAVATTMFFGGWHAPWPLSHVEFLNSGWWGLLWFFLKIWFFMFLLIWTRATLLRFRYDQFMNLGWKRLMPIALGWLVLVALVRGITQFVQLPNHVLFGGVGGLFLIALVIIWLTDKPEPEPVTASEREYTGFEDGFPVPPLPGQTPVASPRATATIEGTLATASALESPKEATDE